jgi:uncharacterized OsmC-like protein
MKLARERDRRGRPRQNFASCRATGETRAFVDVRQVGSLSSAQNADVLSQDFMDAKPFLKYDINARRINAHGSLALSKDAEITLDTDPAGRRDAFNPAELMLAALAACMIKGIERVIPILKFQLDGVNVRLHGERQDSPPKMVSITYELIVDTHESDERLALLHRNVRGYGTIYNTLAGATELSGTIRRAETIGV